MIFFTRRLYRDYQVDRPARVQRQAMRTWERNRKTYDRYLRVIAPMVPPVVLRLCRASLHDGVVKSATLRNRQLHLRVDLSHALSGLGRGWVELVFRGVRGQVATASLRDQWWLYEEVHLSANRRFALHVMLDDTDLTIEADRLTIRVKPARR